MAAPQPIQGSGFVVCHRVGGSIPPCWQLAKEGGVCRLKPTHPGGPQGTKLIGIPRIVDDVAKFVGIVAKVVELLRQVGTEVANVLQLMLTDRRIVGHVLVNRLTSANGLSHGGAVVLAGMFQERRVIPRGSIGGA